MPPFEENPRFITRADVDELRSQLEMDQAAADDAAVVALRPGAPPADPLLQQRADNTRSSLSSAEETLSQQLDDEPKLFSDNNTDPIALLPVRIETVWWTESGTPPDPNAVATGDANPPTLRVRVYPDDLQLTHLDTQLTTTEAEAAAAYWQDPGPAGWQKLLERVRPDRAAWAVRAARPGAPPPVIRPNDGPRPTRTVTMPDRWRFIGFVDGKVVTDLTGLDIPDPLPLDILESENSWTVNWFEAVLAGMAVELDLHGADHLDELLVIGVRDEPATDGAQLLEDLLRDHAFSAGLGMLTAGTPTNNTPGSRSGWSSGPSFPPPGNDPGPGERPVADALAGALGLPDATFLRSCSGATDSEPAVVAALSMLTWAALGRGFAESSLTRVNGSDGRPTAVGAFRPWRDIRDHFLAHVRSRGPLPMIRIGRQPYGVLPASSLSDWRAEHAEDADAAIAAWCNRLREKWRGVLDTIPQVGKADEAQSSDLLMVDILERQPTATGLAMRRMNGPTVAVPRTHPGTTPSNSIAGLDPGSALRWTTSSDAWTDLGWDDPFAVVPDFVTRMTQGHEGFSSAAARTADYLHAVRTFLAGDLTAGDYHAQWPVLRSDGETPVRDTTFFDMPDGSYVLEAIVCVRNWAFLEDEDDPLRNAFMVTADVDQTVSTILDSENLGEDIQGERPRVRGDLRDQITAAATWVDTMARIESGPAIGRGGPAAPYRRTGHGGHRRLLAPAGRVGDLAGIAPARPPARVGHGRHPSRRLRLGGEPAAHAGPTNSGPRRCRARHRVGAGRLHSRTVAAAGDIGGRAALGFTQPSRRRHLRRQPELPPQQDRPLADRRRAARSESRRTARLPVRARPA